MLYVSKYLNANRLLSSNTSYLRTVRHNIRDLYKKAADFLSLDVLLNSEFILMKRPNTNQHKVQVLGARFIREGDQSFQESLCKSLLFSHPEQHGAKYVPIYCWFVEAVLGVGFTKPLRNEP
ncbi:hypothetical protein F5Y12DRAFT_711392 [Xylaria sp. FL1777]|nr:hypothetical protein F5Y12DRAFT_711392 [Xylaria sp. FL1777]